MITDEWNGGSRCARQLECRTSSKLEIYIEAHLQLLYQYGDNYLEYIEELERNGVTI